jgi:hypothetical protein
LPARSTRDHHESTRSPDPAPIPFIDVAAQRRRLGRSVDEAIARVLGHCQFILGPEVRAFDPRWPRSAVRAMR